MKAEDFGTFPYSRILIPDENGGFHAEVLEFPGCYADGETTDEAFENLEGAAQSWISATQKSGQEVPEPSINYGYGGKVALRLPRSLHRQAARLADRDGTSLNQYLVTAVAARVGAEDLYTRMVNRLESLSNNFIPNHHTFIHVQCVVGTAAVANTNPIELKNSSWHLLSSNIQK